MGSGSRKNETLVRGQLEAELLGQLIPRDLQRQVSSWCAALRSSCSQWSCRDLQLMKLKLPGLQASGADSLLGAAAGCGYGVRRH